MHAGMIALAPLAVHFSREASAEKVQDFAVKASRFTAQHTPRIGNDAAQKGLPHPSPASSAL
jgi:hypothetical protein